MRSISGLFAAAAAASLSLAGCQSSVHSDPPPPCAAPAITVAWSGFRAADGHLLDCAAAYVAAVDVYVDGTRIPARCTDGGATVDAQPGAHTVTVEGLEPDGRIAFRDVVQATAPQCGGVSVATQPAEGTLDLDYHFQPYDQCAGTVSSPSYIWFSVYDEIAGKITAEASGSTAPATYACGDLVTPPVFPLPAGPYRLLWAEEAIPVSSTTWQVTAASCTAQAFTVSAATTAVLPVVMTDTAQACP
jgi:hypothetical protein